MSDKNSPAPLTVEEVVRHVKMAKLYRKRELIAVARDRFDVVYPPQTTKPQLLIHFLSTADFIRRQILSAQNPGTLRSPM